MGDKEDSDKGRMRNRKKKDERDLRKMAPQQRSRYLAYEEPPKDVVEQQTNAAKRLIEQRKKFERDNAPPTDEEVSEKDKHEKLIGQLKAAEARNRLRIMRLRYQSSRAQEISHLIACQPTALKAVRLQALVPSYPDTKDRGDTLDKLDAQEISHLIACQPTALKAVRLQALVPSYPDTKDRGDTLDKLDRERAEQLLEDAQGLLTNRIH